MVMRDKKCSRYDNTIICLKHKMIVHPNIPTVLYCEYGCGYVQNYVFKIIRALISFPLNGKEILNIFLKLHKL